MKRLLVLSLILTLVSGSVLSAERQRASRRANKRAQTQQRQSETTPSKNTSSAPSDSLKAVTLTLGKPSAAPADAVSLWTPLDQRQDGDALAHYQAAVEKMASLGDDAKLRTLSKQPIASWPNAEATALLERYQPVLAALHQGRSQRDCSWPPASNTATPNLKGYRSLTWLLAVQARQAMAQGHPAQAIDTMQAGLELGHHVAQGPVLVQGMTGVAIASVMCQQLEDLLQCHGVPKLHAALHSLPRPYISLETQMQAEIDNLDNHPQVNALNRYMFQKQLKETHDRIRLLTRNLSRRLAAIETIAALREYAAKHQGQFPKDLSQITSIEIPPDPCTQKPFQYKGSGHTATLQAPVPAGGRAKDALHYILITE